ncbi:MULTISPECIES: Bug family tripartite tricarboxylate transporter substrate binding protein [Variovorax]|jgi:tripartite-type tricarboxylate transporter receptor subunit TctC|uniref:Bug family tripartite tricarboxylate transporter substrate binding protein n=1 Tax=Variovorax TaxID=34072 RepID=UPI00086D53DD|nr:MULTISPECIES: tripartite tricarboxylate transporter substrate binding protein [Variovorax]MBN8753555.1 tripartite tricarboxylate transporter substrate binding protein [Variovorax sp.]ODU12958.1 MAG: MFS transporter [Variovorax sp. SCN 67-85]ODV27492.1 MAG: MFS transporter [Variovorax sp. SCN 67-20]OJZ12184.1 MAG: MFS transporter [Variovorax sp. 67-131]UKI05979.1 tripartite tricarboxylate transporter substrate binding protein [Variovorax paradoxus]
MHRRTLIRTALASSLAAGLPAFAQSSNNWPTGKAITYLVPFPAGGTTDVLGRLIAQKLGPVLGTSVIIDNKGGAGGSVGSEVGARAAPDGFTLVGGTISSHAINVSLYPKIGYDPIKSFAPVTLIGTNPVVLVVSQNSPYKTLKDILDASKAKSGGLSSASAGTGTSQHLALELLAYKSGVKFTHIPYKGSGPAIQDAIGGQVDMMFDTTVVAGPHIQSGKLRAIAVTSAKRLASLPDVPTIAESGLPGLKDFEVVSWQAIFVPAGTPAPVIDRLHTEIRKILATPEMQDKLKGFGMEPTDMTTTQIAAFQKAEVEKWAQVIKAAGIKAD